MTSLLPTVDTVLASTNLSYTTYSSVFTAGVNESGVAVTASWTSTSPAAKTFVSGTKATLTLPDLTYTADLVGTAGNSITIEYADSVKASKVIDDITYTADAKGSAGNAITVAYTSGGSAGAEVVTVVGNDISVAIQDQATYAVKTFTTGTFATGTFQNIAYKSKLITALNYIQIAYTGGGFGGQESAARSGTGVLGDPYIVTVTMQGSNEYSTKLFNAGTAPSLLSEGMTFTSVTRSVAPYIEIDFDGGGTAGAEVVTVSGLGTAIDPYKILIVAESGVSTNAQVKTAYDLVAAVTAKATCAVTTPGTVSGTVSTPLAGGVDSSIAVATNVITTTTAHSYIPGMRFRVTTPVPGSLPATLAPGTDYWIKTTPAGNTFTLTDTYGGAEFDLTDQGDSGVQFSIVPYATQTSEIEAAIALDANSALTVARTVGAEIDQTTQVATSLTGGVASPIDQTANTITVPLHGYTTGNKVAITGGALPTLLVSPAWVVVIDPNTLKFANSYANATVGPVVLDLTSDGAETTTYTITPAYSTATMVKAAVDASVAAAALVDTSITGTAGDYQVITAATNLAGGFGGAAGSEEVVVTGTAIKVYIEDGVSTSDQVKAAVNAAAAATALVDVSGAGATAQVVTAATPLATGTNNAFNKSTEASPNQITIAAHGYITGTKIAGMTTTGTVPTGFALLTPYYVIYVSATAIKLAASLADAIAGTAVPITGDGTGTHTLTPTATAGTVALENSVDNSVWLDVVAGFGGVTQDMTAASGYIWSVNGYQPCYFRLKFTVTAGIFTGAVAKYTSK